MKVVLDLDSHQAIQDFTVNSPAGPYQFKSQDTVEWELYFVQGGVVQDLGAGFALKFGMIKTGDTTNTILAYQTVFSHLTDVNGNVYYSGLVNFNTSQMATAIGTSPSIQGSVEIRYQDADNEIIHTINISTVVYATILVETGVTPPGVSTGYPDASTIELLVHKNAASGYAGLSTGSLLTGSQIPVDSQTIQINANGQVAFASILATVATNFTTPAANANVSVTLSSTSNLKAGQYVRIPIAGYYIVESITSGTVAVLQNNGDPFNASSGTTITSGAVVLPAQAATSGSGSPGQNAFTTTLASFTVPASGATVSVNMGATSWLPGSGYVVFIAGAGYYAVSSVPDATHAVLTNLGYAATNAASGTVIASGANVSPGALQGPAGAGALGANAYDTTQVSFVMPAAAATVQVSITNTNWLGIGQQVFIQGAGYFSVASITSPTIFNATNSNYPGAAAPGATIAAGARVSPGGLIGPQGAGGAGVNAYTTLTTSFTQPALNATVTAVVGTTAWMTANLIIYVAGGGYYQVSSVTDLTHVILVNLGYTGNAAIGASVSGSGTQLITSGGLIGPVGASAYTTTTASFTQPAALTSVSVSLVSTAFLLQNQNIYIGGAGYFSVSNIVDSTHITAINLGSPGNVTSGTTIPNGAGVTVAGSTGPAVNTSGGFSTAADAISPAGTGEVSEIYTQTGGVLALKKFKSGPAGSVALTDNGGTTGDVLIDVPVDGSTITVVGGKLTAAGGGGGLTTPANGIEILQDFYAGSAPDSWNMAGNGVTIGYNQTVGTNATGKGAGVISMPCGTGVPNRSVVNHGTSATDGNFGYFVPALGILDLQFRVWLSALYTSSANYSVIRLGLITDNGTGAIVNGIYFEHDYSQNAGNWIGTTVSASSFSRSNSSTALAAGQWMNLRLLTNAGWTSVSFYMNGTLAVTKSSFTLPTNNTPIALYHAFAAGSGLSTLYVDSVYMKYTYSRGTW